MTSGQSSDVLFRYLDGGGQWVATTLAEVDGAAVARGRPVRAFPTHKGQRNYPGWCGPRLPGYSGSPVAYESLLERDRVWLADFDPSVRWIASQPLWVSGRDGERLRRHVPDFLLDTNWEPEELRIRQVGRYPLETWRQPDSQLGPKHQLLRDALREELRRLAHGSPLADRQPVSLGHSHPRRLSSALLTRARILS